MDHALLHDGLDYWARHTPDKPALLLDVDEALTYADLAKWSDGIAAAIQRRGVLPGDNVGIIGNNSFEWVAAAFGILKAGGVIVPLNERFVASELAHLIRTTQPTLILADPARREHLDRVEGLPGIMWFASLADCRGGAEPGWQAVRVDASSLAQIIFTSGTTSAPKGVMISHERLLAKYYEMRLMFPDYGSPDMRLLMCVGLQSGLGTTWGYLSTTLNGGTMSFLRRFDPAMVLCQLIEHRITVMPAFPLLYDQISRQPAFADADLSALRIAITGGARIPADVLDTWRRKGVYLRSMYGLTEGGNYVSIASEAEVVAGRVSCGPPMLFTRICVRRDDGEAAAAGEPGEIFVRGPGMMVGYWRNPEATAAAFADGWLQTGDMGVIDEEGYLSFIDRAKDMIITGGFNVSPSEVEAVIGELNGVQEVAVIAIPDPKFGEVPGACIFASSPVSTQDVHDFCRARLAGFKLPRHVFISEGPLPRNANSKIDKKRLALDYGATPERIAKSHAGAGITGSDQAKADAC